VGTTDTAKKAIKDLFGGIEVFDTPKPIPLLQRLIQISTTHQHEEIILDFFGGAAPLGEAVYRQNLTDSGKRRFFVVQLPETLPDDSPARQISFGTLSQVAIDRLRRAAKEIEDENPMFTGDLGFRVFKLDTSNIRAWNPIPGDLESDLLTHLDHLLEGRNESDILYELLLKLGLDLCVPIETKTIYPQMAQMSADRKTPIHLRVSASSADHSTDSSADKPGLKVYAVGGGVLLACLAEKIGRDDVEPLAQGIVAWHEALAPAGDTTCVFRDSAFADDVAKTNLAAILEQHCIQNVRSL
jgi:adenine-specific DNA-methyltransferase